VNDNLLLFYVHGGAFYAGSPSSFLVPVLQLASQLNANVFSVGYGLMPEYKLKDVLPCIDSAFYWLKRNYNIPKSKLVIYGDSAGGNAILSFLLSRRNSSEFACAFASSPWIDLLCSQYPIEQYVDKDVLLEPNKLRTFVYEEDRDALDIHNPMSTRYDDELGNLPPLFIFVSPYEIFYPSIMAFAKKAQQKGAEVVLDADRPFSTHCMNLLGETVPEGKDINRQAANFILKHTNNGK
jgi:monoterpene epsilon-lactone hydrolase